MVLLIMIMSMEIIDEGFKVMTGMIIKTTI